MDFITQTKRILTIGAGFTIILIGITLLVLPGPGWLVILLGLTILGRYFTWARHTHHSVEKRVKTVGRTAVELYQQEAAQNLKKKVTASKTYSRARQQVEKRRKSNPGKTSGR